MKGTPTSMTTQTEPIPDTTTILLQVFSLEDITYLIHSNTKDTHVFLASPSPEHTPAYIRERLEFLARIVTNLSPVFTPQEIFAWFDTPQPDFLDATPFSMFEPGWSPGDTALQKLLATTVGEPSLNSLAEPYPALPPPELVKNVALLLAQSYSHNKYRDNPDFDSRWWRKLSPEQKRYYLEDEQGAEEYWQIENNAKIEATVDDIVDEICHQVSTDADGERSIRFPTYRELAETVLSNETILNLILSHYAQTRHEG